MTVSLRERRVTGVVVDIEGTTTPVSFVYETLFPYARANLPAFLTARRGDPVVGTMLRDLRAEHANDLEAGEEPPGGSWDTMDRAIAAAVAYVGWLMDRDRKSPALKALQGVVWEAGYRDGTLRGELFPDVPGALMRWAQAGQAVAIYSSGSVLAQRLLFGHSTYGDLTLLIGHFFDTTVGQKRAPESYVNIAEAMRCAPGALLFVSDMVTELDAARTAGLQSVLCIRPGNAAQVAGAYPTIASLDEIR